MEGDAKLGATFPDRAAGRSPRRCLIPAALAFAAGTWAARALGLEPAHLLWAAPALALAAALPAWLFRSARGMAAAALSLAAVAGGLNFAVRSAAPRPSEVGSLLLLDGGGRRLALVTGRAAEVAPLPPGETGLRLTLDVESVGSGPAEVPASGRVRVYLRGEPPGGRPLPGERLRLPLLVSRPGGSSAPGTGDFRERAAGWGVWTSGSGRAELVERLPAGAPSATALLGRLRERLAGIVSRELPEREGALLNTMLLGWRADMDAEDALAFSRTGTGHLLAVSGIHVMLLVGAVWWLLRQAGLRPRAAALVLIVFALAYAELAGARSPVVRAAAMAGLLLGGILLGREADSLNSLAAAALLVLAAWPRELFSTGFQMSFAAVFFVMTAAPALDRAWRARRDPLERLDVLGRRSLRRRAGEWLRLSLFSSLAATAGTLPLLVGAFGAMSPWSPLVNLVAIPVAGAALAAGLGLLAVGSLAPFLAPAPAALAWAALRALVLVVDAAARLPGSWLDVDRPPAPATAAYYLAAVPLLMPGLVPAAWRARAAAAALLLAVPASLAGALPARAPEGMRVTLLAPERGRTALLEDASGRCGAVWSGGTGRALTGLLRAERLGAPERTLLLSDRPEAVSGAAHLVSSRRAGKLALPQGELPAGAPTELAHGAERLAPGWTAALGGTRLEVLGAAPAETGRSAGASRPLMLLASRGGRAVLFADLSPGRWVTAAAEELERRQLRADLVVLDFTWRPARDSARLLRASGARVALVKLGPELAGEPAARELLAMLRACGMVPLTTGGHGTLRAALTDSGVAVERFEPGGWAPLLAAPPARRRSSQ